MNRLRVGLGTTMLEPGSNGARLDGIGVYTEALLRHLPQAGCSVSAYSYPPVARAGLRAGIRTGMRAVVGQPMAQSFEAASLVDLVTPRINRVHMPADIFHATDYRIVRMDCPVVATLHDALPLRHPQWCNPRLRGPKNWLQKKAAAKADHVIAVSHFAVAELVQCFGIDERRISVVPCGVEASWLEPAEPAAVAATLHANGLRSGYFLFVGTLQPRKNIERLLAAYLGLPASVRAERQLVIVGALGWRCDALARQIMAARQNGANVVWLRSLTDNARLRHVYAGAGVFVFASLYEGFGIPVLEAFASAVPVVVANSSALPEVAHGAALEVDPCSICEIGAAMLALVRDEPLRARCIAAGRLRAAQLSWREAARRTAAVYRNVLSH